MSERTTILWLMFAAFALALALAKLGQFMGHSW